MQVRPTTIVPGILTSAAGSALVRMGPTQVTAAISWQIGQTTSATVGLPEQGDVRVQIERAGGSYPASAPNYVALQSCVQRLLQDSAINWTQLSIRPGWAWRAVVSVTILNDAGSVLDAVLLSAVAALRQAKLPTDLQDRQGKLWIRPGGTSKSLELPADVLPTSLTVGLWQNEGQPRWVVDPTATEEAALEGTMTLVVANNTLWGVEFHGECIDFATHLTMLQHLAVERAKEVHSILNSE